MPAQAGLARARSCCCCCPGSWAITAAPSHFPSLFLPSPIFLLPLPCSPFSRALLTLQLCCCAPLSSSCPLPAGLSLSLAVLGLVSILFLLFLFARSSCSDLAMPQAGGSSCWSWWISDGHSESAQAVLGVPRASLSCHPAHSPPSS